jgi:hypothetical protein
MGKEKGEKGKKESSYSEKLRKRFYKEIEDVKYTIDEKRTYFEELYKLFIQIEWQQLYPWDRFRFLRQCFVFVSDEFLKANLKYELLRKQIVHVPVSPINDLDVETENDLLDMEDDYIWYVESSDYFDKKGKRFYTIAIDYFDEFISKEYINYLFKKLIPDSIKDASLGQSFIAQRTTPKELDFISELEKYKYIDPMRFYSIDIKYPLKVIWNELKKLIKDDQQKWFTKRPEGKPHYIKETKDGRHDTYPFDEWERYLKVYMLKQQGKTTNELAKQFYSKYHQDPKRQLLRDYNKAKKLSQNALNGNFPGKY